MSADVHGLVGAYAVDAVDEQERAAFERHLAQCAECQAEVASLREAGASLSVLSQTAPPAGMRDAVLASIRTVRPLPPLDRWPAGTQRHAPATGEVDNGEVDDDHGHDSADRTGADPSGANVVALRPRRRAATWLAAVAAAAAIAVGTVAWSPWDDGPQRNQVTATQQVLQATDAQRVAKTIDGARATVVRSASLGKAVIVADDMPPAPDGKDYQLWFNQPGKGMVSAGVMPHDAAATQTVLLKGDASTALAVGITVEPAGGSPEPTTVPIALFALS
jgi:anti-sigma-K factor RskA